MELQQLTEQMLLAVTSLNRSCIPQSVQEPLKGENFLLDYLSAQNGCSTPGALREVLGVSAPRTAAMLRALEEKGMLRRCADSPDRARPPDGGADACGAVCARSACSGATGRTGFPRVDPAAGPHHGDRGRHLSEQVSVFSRFHIQGDSFMKKYIQEHKYVLLVLYLPIYLIWFALVERMVPSTEGCFVSYLPLDDKIPFLPGFILAYVLWYPFLIVPVVVTLLKDDRRAFIRYAAFIIAGFSISLTICMIWPNCQLLRPSDVDTSTLCGWLVNAIYSADTPTNVLPSMHVVGCMAVLAVTFDSKYLKKVRIPAVIIAVAICAATVFVKQHSILDVFAALALSLVLYLIIYVAARRAVDRRQPSAAA